MTDLTRQLWVTPTMSRRITRGRDQALFKGVAFVISHGQKGPQDSQYHYRNPSESVTFPAQSPHRNDTGKSVRFENRLFTEK